MINGNNQDKVRMQYKSEKNLNARRMLHKHFSTNKYGWENWVFDQYMIKPNARILELGCGNGAMWKENKDRIPEHIEIVLGDLSGGMLAAARENLGDIGQVTKYSIMDIQNIDYEDNCFDVVIANHMLYHVPDRDLAIKEVARVLKPDGAFYAATNGINTMKGFKELLEGFDSRIRYGTGTNSLAEKFGLENGTEQLLRHFDTVEMRSYEDSFHITEAQPLVDYVLSLEGLSGVLDVIKGDRIDDFHAYVAEIISSRGSIDMAKSTGMFVAMNPES